MLWRHRGRMVLAPHQAAREGWLMRVYLQIGNPDDPSGTCFSLRSRSWSWPRSRSDVARPCTPHSKDRRAAPGLHRCALRDRVTAHHDIPRDPSLARTRSSSGSARVRPGLGRDGRALVCAHASHVHEPRASPLDDAPPEVARARIQAEHDGHWLSSPLRGSRVPRPRCRSPRRRSARRRGRRAPRRGSGRLPLRGLRRPSCS